MMIFSQCLLKRVHIHTHTHVGNDGDNNDDDDDKDVGGSGVGINKVTTIMIEEDVIVVTKMVTTRSMTLLVCFCSLSVKVRADINVSVCLWLLFQCSIFFPCFFVMQCSYVFTTVTTSSRFGGEKCTIKLKVICTTFALRSNDQKALFCSKSQNYKFTM